MLVNEFSIGSLFHHKERLNKGMLSSLVYEYVCPRCELSYIGSTSRNLLTRVAEHAGVSYRTGVPLSNPPHSSIRDHNLDCIPTIQIENFTILGMSANDENLKVLESLHIHFKKPALNNMQSAYPLQTVRL